METVILSLILFGLVVAGMAIGAVVQNKPLKGSCGGLNAVGIDGDCEICGGDLSRCEEPNDDSQRGAGSKAYDPSLVTDASKPQP